MVELQLQLRLLIRGVSLPLRSSCAKNTLIYSSVSPFLGRRCESDFLMWFDTPAVKSPKDTEV